ncbi:UNVERIFIED_CONTAM: hypothetical protein Sangu_3015100 [Sesamum angustifolium]|uniref:DUF4283 domain-containing protein n=1 Tax=Sesamum angustifolium TaxID=2727405 RepID=A0AAW2KLE2_9LAMI
MIKAKKSRKIVAAAACPESALPCKKESGQPSANPPANSQPAPFLPRYLQLPSRPLPLSRPRSLLVEQRLPAYASRPKNALPTKHKLSTVEATTTKARDMVTMPATVSAKSSTGAEVGTTDLLESSPSLAENLDHGHRSKDAQSAKELGYCLVGYIADKFPGLQAIRALSKSWGSLFQLYNSGWLIFHFAQDNDRQRVLAGGTYFLYGRPLFLQGMPDYFEFKEDSFDTGLGHPPVAPSRVLAPQHSCKICSKLGTPIAMDSLTMKMERVSYARILVEVDVSKPLVDHVDLMLPNGVRRSQPVAYEFTPKFCTKCNWFGHLEGSCQRTQPPAAGAAMLASTATTDIPPESKKVQPTEWTVVKRKKQKQQQAGKGHSHGKGVQGQSAVLADEVAKGRSISLASKDVQNQSGPLKPQQNEIAPVAELTQSPLDSSASPDETDSQTSTQHFMPGTS